MTTTVTIMTTRLRRRRRPPKLPTTITTMTTAALSPHFWLDPTRMADAAKQVHAALVKADPSHKADYDANLKTTLAKLTKLDTSYKQGLSQCTRKTFVTSHAAFGYLAERYGLTQVSVSGIDPDSEPSPADIAKVKQVVKQTGHHHHLHSKS